jgi:hypothetical protein
LNAVELTRYRFITILVFWYFEDQFHQHQDGLFSDDRFAGSVATIVIDCQRHPGFQIVWKQA